MNSSPWRLEEVDGGDEQYPMESRFAVRHNPPVEHDPRFDPSAPTQVCFLRFAVRQTPPDEQDPVSTVAAEHKAVSSVPRYTKPRFHWLFHPSRLAPDEQHAFRCLPMNTTHFVASP